MEKIYIKNMVCSRCKMVVQSEFEKLGLITTKVELGEVEVNKTISDTQKLELLKNLQALGFDVINDKKTKTVEKIKNLIINLVHHKNDEINSNLSEYISLHFTQDYNTLSNIFSEIQQTTIEKYFINQKIEKIKELIIYDELNLSEIALQLNYSSISHLSNQFKKVTGLSPTQFKQQKDKKRQQIEDV